MRFCESIKILFNWKVISLPRNTICFQYLCYFLKCKDICSAHLRYIGIHIIFKLNIWFTYHLYTSLTVKTRTQEPANYYLPHGHIHTPNDNIIQSSYFYPFYEAAVQFLSRIISPCKVSFAAYKLCRPWTSMTGALSDNTLPTCFYAYLSVKVHEEDLPEYGRMEWFIRVIRCWDLLILMTCCYNAGCI